MKKLIGISILSLFLLAWAPSVSAQEDTSGVGHAVKKGAQKTGHAVKEGGEAVGHGAKKAGHAVGEGAEATGKKTAEVGSKSKAKVTDQVYKNKVGPDGQTVYIDSKDQYYWIDKKGHKHYVTSAQLKNKPPKQ